LLPIVVAILVFIKAHINSKNIQKLLILHKI